ncbi:MAG: c-type cytochrome domain-containing protein [Planctomycetaceae bacterium]
MSRVERRLLPALWLLILAGPLVSAEDATTSPPIVAVEPKLGRPVDFERDVYPILDAKCIACHNLAISESRLNLEQPQQMAKGGKRGPPVVAGEPEQSLLYRLAARAAKPAMPPLPNKVEATALTPAELGLLRQWIVEGADTRKGAESRSTAWRPLPAGVQPIYAISLTSDGQFAAAGRGNSVVIYHVPTGALVATLADPALTQWQHQGRPMYAPEAAHRDYVYSLAFDPSGTMLASGSYREVKLWTRPETSVRLNLADLGGAVSTAAASRDGKLLAVAASDHSIRLIDLATGQLLKKLEGHAAAPMGLAFSADGATVYSCAHDNSVKIWQVAQGAAAGAIELPVAANGIALSSDGQRAVVASADGQLRIVTLDPASRGVERSFAAHSGGVAAVAFVGPSGERLVSGGADGTLKVWEFLSGKELASLNHQSAVSAVAASPDGQRLASAGANGVVRLWNASNNQQLAEMKGDLRANAEEARLVADEAEAKAAVTATRTAIAGAEKALGERTEARKKAEEAQTAAVKAAADTAAKLQAAQTAQEAAQKAADEKKDDAELQKSLATATQALKAAQMAAKNAEEAKKSASIVFQQSERDVAAANEAVAKSKADLETATNLQTARAEALAEAKARALQQVRPLVALCFSPNGSELAAGGDSSTVYTFDGKTGAPFAALDGHTGSIRALAYAGPRLLVSAAADQSAKMWDLNPPWALAAVLGPSQGAAGAGADAGAASPSDTDTSVFVDRVLCLAFSPDGALLAAGGGDPSRAGELTLWDVPRRALVRTLEDAHSDTVMGVEFSHDGQFLLSGAADKFAKIHEVATGAFIRAFEGHTSHVLAVSWRHGDRQIASAGADNVIKIWNVETGEQQRTITGFTKQVTSLVYPGRGPNLLSCAGDKTVRFHQADNGNNFRNFAGSGDFMYAVAASADEKTVVAGGLDGVLRIWNGANAQVLKTIEPPRAAEAAAK